MPFAEHGWGRGHDHTKQATSPAMAGFDWPRPSALLNPAFDRDPTGAQQAAEGGSDHGRDQEEQH